MNTTHIKSAHFAFRLALLVAATASISPLSASAQVPAHISRLPQTVYLPASAEKLITATPDVKDLAKLSHKSLLSVAAGPAALLEVQRHLQAFLSDNAKELGLEGNVARLVTKDTRETLTGRYVSLEQKVNDLPVLDSQVQIIFNQEGKVQSLTRNVVSVPEAFLPWVKSKTELEPKAAQDIVWKDLKVTGDFLEAPRVDKAYLQEENSLTLVYVVKIAVTKPFGYWEYRVDASTGRIISKKDRRVNDKRSVPGGPPEGDAPSGPLSDQAAALEKFQVGLKKMAFVAKSLKSSNGTGLIFQPNPISALNDASLQDSDQSGKFDKAYVSVILEKLTDNGGKLSLNGPLVHIEDFEPGEGGKTIPPSTSTGAWTAKRGDNAFNDVMTYYYIHSSLSYLRQIGYRDSADLFPAGIAADSDGVNGDDNSHYVPGSDRLAFGHGCVDDNEDCDVIMHELGHAITYHIDPAWGGGDAGAIGEGFGDYWAVSTRRRTNNGMNIDPRKVFIWDGSDSCWSGRRSDRDNATYDEKHRYGAHENLPQIVSDELWATPLVSALFEIINAGETQESVDRVVLEGMAGIGNNFTMRTLALATVEKAKQLFPGKPHAAVFEKYFKHHGIIK